MPLLNGSAHRTSNGSAMRDIAENKGVENLGFRGSNSSLTQDTTADHQQPVAVEGMVMPVLDEDQRILVKNSWKMIEPNYELYGAMMFAKLTTDNPDIGKIFPFGVKNLTYGQLLVDPDVRAHGKRVMETLGSVIDDLEDMELVIPILEDLGQRHNGYNAKKTHIKAVGQALIHMLQEGIGQGFTDDVKAAWIAVFNIVSDTMSTKLSDGPLTTREKELVRKTWSVLSIDPEQHGATMFAKLVIDHPAVGRLFPFGDKNLSYDQLLQNSDARSHGRRVMETIGQAVGSLDDLDILVPILRDLARRHVGYSVTKQQFAPVGEALIHAIQEGLGGSFSEEVKSSWLAVFSLVSTTMSDKLPEEPKEILSADHKRLVQESWKKLAKDPERHGATMFAKLTTSHPDVGKLFPFGGKNLTYDQLLRNRDVKSHGRRVMETVGHAVNGLDDLDLLVPILQELARRHVGYTVQKRQFAPVGEALIHAVRVGLGSAFTTDVSDAWTAVFKIIVDVMSEQLPDGPITTTQKNLVQTSWKTLARDPEKHGAVMFANLVGENPQLGKLFPFASQNLNHAELLANRELRAHGKRIMETVGVAVSGLDDLELLVPILQDLSRRHVGYHVTKQHFKPVEVALMHAIKEGLGNTFTQELSDAWLAVLKLVVETMSPLLPDGGLTFEQKNLIKKSWRTMSPEITRHGAVMFAKLVTDYPEVGQLFPFGRKNLSQRELLADAKLKAHGLRVMQTVGSTVKGLDDTDRLVPVLKELAKRHVGYGVIKEHFSPVGESLLHSVKEALGNAFDAETETAWLALWQLIEVTMSELTDDEGPLTTRQKELVQRSWKKLASDPAGHGAVMFARLTTDHPEVGRLFPFGGRGLTYEQLLQNDDARAHGRRVMETVGYAVQGLDDLDLLVPILQELARRHVGYSVTKTQFEPVGEALIYAIEKGLGDTFDEETKAAWLAVFGVVVNTMSELLPNSAMEDQGPITQQQKRLVQTTWAKLASDPTRHGSVMFAKLTTDHPTVGKLFPFGGKGLSYQQLLENDEVHAHGKRVMETVGAAVSGLDDLDLLVPILRDLGMRHVGYNVTKQHFEPVGAALIYAIKEGLGSSFTPDVESAWLVVFQLVVNTMSDVLPEGGPLTAAHKLLVKQTWRTLAADPAKHGAAMFAKLVTSHPSVGRLFSFGRQGLSYSELLSNAEVQAHGRRVMETVGHAVDGLDDLDILVPILQELARRHVQYGVYKQHFTPVGEALLHAIQKGLGSSFNEEIKEAWTAVFKLISETMSEILPEGPITDAQKRLVQETWAKLSNDPAKHGATMFAKLTTDDPKIGKLFPFGTKNLSYNQLIEEPEVRAHGTRVMQTIGHAVDGLNDLDLLVPVLRDLATKHRAYGATKQHFSPVGAALMHAIKEGLGVEFNDDVEKAWLAVFQFVVDTMSDELPEGVLTSRQKELVQETWKKLSTDPEKHGAVMFARLTTAHPAVGKLFAFGRKHLSYEQLLADPEVKAHGSRVIGTVGHAVSGLDDLDLLVPILEDLAMRHRQYGVTRSHFAPVGEALLYAVRAGLGEGCTTEIASAWEAVFSLVTNTMSELLPDDNSEAPLTSEQIRLVRESWKKLSADPDKHGAVMFARLTTQSPIVGRLFPFGGKNLSYGQLISNPQLRAHGTRVMETVGHAVDALDSLEVLVPVLKDLATRHTEYHVTKQHFEPVGKALMYAIKEGLGSSLNAEIEDAWSAVFHLITKTMSEVLSAGPMLSQHLKVVKTTWEMLAEDTEKHGAIMFAKLVTDHPLVGSLFSFGGKNLSYDQLLQNDDVRKHGRRFMEVVRSVVNNLENHETLVPMLEDLAKRHTGYGVTRQHFPIAGEALMHAIKEALDEGFTDDVRQAWGAAFQVVVDFMSEKLPDGRRTTGREIATMPDRQREVVQRTWETISPATDKHGAVMFAKLVSEYPKVGKLFPFGKKKQSYKKLLKEKSLISHGERFMNTLGQVVGGLDDISMLVPILHQLAIRHASYGVTKEQFQAVRSALIYSLRQGMGKSAFTKEVQDAWMAAFQLIEDIMSEKL